MRRLPHAGQDVIRDWHAARRLAFAPVLLIFCAGLRKRVPSACANLRNLRWINGVLAWNPDCEKGADQGADIDAK